MAQDKMGLIVEFADRPDVVTADDLNTGDFFMYATGDNKAVYIADDDDGATAVFGSNAGDYQRFDGDEAVVPVTILGQVKVIIQK